MISTLRPSAAIAPARQTQFKNSCWPASSICAVVRLRQRAKFPEASSSGPVARDIGVELERTQSQMHGSRPSHPMPHPMSPCPHPPDADRRRTAPSYYILTNLGQRDEPREKCPPSRHDVYPYPG